MLRREMTSTVNITRRFHAAAAGSPSLRTFQARRKPGCPIALAERCVR
jgi:hypothetical protein